MKNLIIINDCGSNFRSREEEFKKLPIKKVKFLKEKLISSPGYLEEIKKIYDFNPTDFKFNLLLKKNREKFPVLFYGIDELGNVVTITFNPNAKFQVEHEPDYSKRKENSTIVIEYMSEKNCIELSHELNFQGIFSFLVDLSEKFNGLEICYKEEDIIDERYLCSINLGIHDFYWE